MLLCRRLVLPHRGVGEGQSPAPCLYLPRVLIVAHILEIRKQFFSGNPIFQAVFFLKKSSRPPQFKKEAAFSQAINL